MKKFVLILSALLICGTAASAEEVLRIKNDITQPVNQPINMQMINIPASEKDKITESSGSDKKPVIISTDEKAAMIKKETEKYKKECYEKVAFPDGVENYSIYNGDSKAGYGRYHDCLKKIMLTELRRMSSPDDMIKMSASIEQMQNGIISFYWELMNRENHGTYGQEVNDIVLGRYFEQLLEDIIHFKYMYQY